jgi:hypothetical protein
VYLSRSFLQNKENSFDKKKEKETEKERERIISREQSSLNVSLRDSPIITLTVLAYLCAKYCHEIPMCAYVVNYVLRIFVFVLRVLLAI